MYSNELSLRTCPVVFCHAREPWFNSADVHIPVFTLLLQSNASLTHESCMPENKTAICPAFGGYKIYFFNHQLPRLLSAVEVLVKLMSMLEWSEVIHVELLKIYQLRSIFASCQLSCLHKLGWNKIYSQDFIIEL